MILLAVAYLAGLLTLPAIAAGVVIVLGVLPAVVERRPKPLPRRWEHLDDELDRFLTDHP